MPIGVALALSGGLLLAACGSGGSNDGDKIKQPATTTAAAPTSTAATPAPTVTQAAAANNSAELPPIQLPSGARNVFEDQHTGNPTKDAILFDNQQWVNSMDEAILKKSEKSASIGFYSTGKALEGAASYVHGYVKDGFTWVGVTRFFDRKVTLAADGSADVVYCSDESKAFDKDKSGKVDSDTTATPKNYVLYNTKLVRNKQGIWQTVGVVSDRGSKQCQP